MSKPWTKQEVELILNDYFQMFHLEATGQSYNKAAFRKALLPKLNNRSEGSIEFKHQNISAVLLKYNIPGINGYKPRFNYQGLLEENVVEYLNQRKEIDIVFEEYAHYAPPLKQEYPDFSKLQVASPSGSNFKETTVPYSRKLWKPNYLEMEQRNRKLGMLGEQLIVEFEKWRLTREGKENLAEKVEWISRDSGDGAGFDILSCNKNGTDRYIEVKTTKAGVFTPFYFSRNELQVSKEKSANFYLYRVFQFGQDPRFFMRSGSFDQICRFEPVGFVGRIA